MSKNNKNKDEEKKYRKELEKLAKTEDIVKREVQKVAKVKYSDDMRYNSRIRAVAMDLMRGLSPSMIADKYHEDWGLGWETVRQYYTRMAREFLAETLITDEFDIRNDLLGKYNYLYYEAMRREDYREAHALLNSIANMTQRFERHVHVFGDINTIELVEVLREDLEEAEQAQDDQDKPDNSYEQLE